MFGQNIDLGERRGAESFLDVSPTRKVAAIVSSGYLVGAGTMMSRTSASKSASAARNWRMVVREDRKSTRLNSSHANIYTLSPTRRSSDLQSSARATWWGRAR